MLIDIVVLSILIIYIHAGPSIAIIEIFIIPAVFAVNILLAVILRLFKINSTSCSD